jgi:enoyl-CoA hydratase
MGFVQEVCAPEATFERALAIAGSVARAAPLGVQAALASSRLARIRGDRVALERLFEALLPVMASEDMQEAVQAFRERREAEFSGR